MDNIKKELAKNTGIIFVGKFSTQIISFLLLPFYTGYLKTAEYGTIDVLITIMSLVLPFITLGIDQSSFRFLVESRKNIKKQNQIISNITICLLFSMILLVCLFYIFNVFITIPYFYYLLLYALSSCIASSFLEITRGLGDNVTYSIANIIIGGGTIIFNVVFMAILSFGPRSIFLSSILSNTIGLIFLITKLQVPLLMNFSEFNFGMIKQFYKYSLPLVPSSVIWWIIATSDRLIITLMIGADANGVYAIANKFSNAIISIYSALYLSWTESMCLYAEDNSNYVYISSTFKEIANATLSICLLMIGVLPIAFQLLINKSYCGAIMYSPILIIGSYFDVIVLIITSLFLSFKKTNQIFVSTLLAGIANVLLNIVLIRKIGLYAAAISTLLSYVLLAIMRTNRLNVFYKLPINNKSVVKLVILFTISLLLFYQRNIIFDIANIVYSISLAFFLNKKTICKIVQTIKNLVFRIKSES